MRRPLIVGGSLALALLLGLGGYYLQPGTAENATSSSSSKLGGPFRLVDQNGRTVTESDLRGKPSLIFFGYTYCPDVCPTTLAHMTAWLKALGPDGDRLNAVYVTIDPERDTPRQLKSYLSAFDPRIRGLTGSPGAIAQIAREYGVYYRKSPLGNGDYAMEHSAAIYMLDQNGRFVRPISYDDTDEKVMPLLRELLAGTLES